jgi:hypothetical protein
MPEFHSVQLAYWLRQRKVDFALRQKKGTCIADDDAVYRALKDLDIKPGKSRFYANIYCTKAHQLGGFNLAAYCQRKYRDRGGKEPWYILTTLKSLPRTLSVYAARWGIETMFRDLKTGGYNLENTKVNERRLMALLNAHFYRLYSGDFSGRFFTTSSRHRLYLSSHAQRDVQQSAIALFGWDCTLPIGVNLFKIGRI